MLLALLVANLAHGLVALAWVAGLRRLTGALSAPAWANLLRLSVVLPPLVLVWQHLGLPALPEHLQVLRPGQWAEALVRAGPGAWVVVGALLGGTTLLFAVQEVIPALRGRRGRTDPAQVPDPRLDAALDRVRRAHAASGLPALRGRPVRALRLETDDRLAGLHGLADRRILVSRGLLAALDEDELDGAVAHELAHLLRGGNLRLLGVWALRVLQAFNPATLILFRSLLETEEAACDAVAVRLVGRPAALASALLKAHGRPAEPPPGTGRFQRARQEVLRRADLASTRHRVRALLDRPRPWSSPGSVMAGAGLLLTFLLWSIG